MTREGDVPGEELADIDARWSHIVDQIREASFTDFLRYHHNARAPLATKRALFATIRRGSPTPKAAFAYLDSLEEDAPVYSALLEPEDAFWDDVGDAAQSRQLRDALRGLRLFNIRQPIPLLMAAYRKFDRGEFAKLARYLYVLSIRYNVVCRRSPSEQEKAYNSLSIGVSSGQHKRASHIKNSPQFKKIYPKDEDFVGAFARLRMPSRRSSKKIRFLLGAIESQLGVTTEHSRTVLEHVCPFHPDGSWSAAFGDGADEVQDRLGTMVLLEKDDLGRASREEKWAAYGTSGRPLAQKVASFDEWTLTAVGEYQNWLAEQARSTWHLDLG
ncbi:MAG: DUF1524 domain-containing protein [Myxococcota bacterium]